MNPLFLQKFFNHQTPAHKGLLFIFFWLLNSIIGNSLTPGYSHALISQVNYLYQRTTSSLPEQNYFDVHYYHIGLDVDFSPDLEQCFIQGRNNIRFSSTIDDLQRIVLDFNTSLKIDSVGGDGFLFSFEKGKITIQLNKEFQKGDNGGVVIYYSGVPLKYHPWLTGWNYTTHQRKSHIEKSPWVSTINPPYGAQSWFPCKDDPRDKADSLRLEITVPETLMAVCNGKLVGIQEVPPHRRRFIWKENYPIATYLVAVNIGRFRTFSANYHDRSIQNLPVVFYVFEEDTEYVKEIRTQIFSMLQFFQGLLGPYPFAGEKYGMIRHNTDGGMENQTITGIQIFHPDRHRLYAHELVHQWAGNLVTNATFAESYLNEGLATYLTALYIQYEEGNEAFRKYLANLRFYGNGPVKIRNIFNPDSVYHSQRVYHKGAWVFHMLRQIVGDSLFFEGLREYFRTYAFSHVNTDSLRIVFEKVSGKNLKEFLDSWINLDGVPEIQGILQRLPDKGTNEVFRYNFSIKQLQKGQPFYCEIPVQFFFKSAKADSLIIFPMKDKKSRFELTFSTPISNFIIDPDQNWLLKIVH